MGISGVFLKKEEEIDYPQIAEDIIQVLNDIGYSYYCEHRKGIIKDINREYDHFQINVWETENFEKQWLMYVYGKEDENLKPTFDWIEKGAELARVIIIEKFSECEDMLLRFAHGYFKTYPDDFFWDELDWYYTKADIDAIMAEPFDKNWCYKKPVRN
ncbi:MAG: hypothetical protein NC124_19705 [Clostridium sp.]|nr:hypothetical protein [Clostridium sp.]